LTSLPATVKKIFFGIEPNTVLLRQEMGLVFLPRSALLRVEAVAFASQFFEEPSS
jgi:hypothetical protein